MNVADYGEGIVLRWQTLLSTVLILTNPPGAGVPLLWPHPNLLAASLSDHFLPSLQTFDFRQANKLRASVLPFVHLVLEGDRWFMKGWHEVSVEVT